MGEILCAHLCMSQSSNFIDYLNVPTRKQDQSGSNVTVQVLNVNVFCCKAALSFIGAVEKIKTLRSEAKNLIFSFAQFSL